MNDEAWAAANDPGTSTSTSVLSINADADNPRMRGLLEATAAETGCSLNSLTVLANQNDPFRLDTPAGHRDGSWLANTAADLGLGDRKVHLRGLHYMVIGRPKPNGQPYTNTNEDWIWLSGNAGKAARYLGYIGFDQIVDQRNATPEVRLFEPEDPRPYLSIGLDIDIPDASELMPYVGVSNFVGVQPYRIVLVGEKSSLADVLGPVAENYRADLYLPTGEISDTLAYQMARTAAEDGRPMVVLYFSDADPSGWQMPISLGRKLQAFNVAMFPALRYEVRRVALLPEQVAQHGLPSTPLKATERRGDAWRAKWGVEQTEIDALAALQPGLLREIATYAIIPFYDSGLAHRVNVARSQWMEQSQQIVMDGLDGQRMAAIRADAAEKLASMQDEIDTINDALRFDVGDFDLPEPVVPRAELNRAANGLPLLDSRWTFEQQCHRLIESKAYRDGDDE